MRPLTDEETTLVFMKLSNYIGDNIKLLLDRSDGVYVFRLHNERVFYASEELVKRAANFARDNLVSFGTCFGKFTKTKKFRLHITALDYLAPYAKYKIWVNPAGEKPFLSGDDVKKKHLGRITESTPRNHGVVVYSMNDTPLGFGVTVKSTQDCRRAEPDALVCHRQADIGEYIRDEEHII